MKDVNEMSLEELRDEVTLRRIGITPQEDWGVEEPRMPEDTERSEESRKDLESRMPLTLALIRGLGRRKIFHKVL
jgi:hypothetical protein